MSERPSFADVRNSTRAHRLCPRCQAPGAREGDVRVLLADAKEKPSRTICSRSIGFCEPCAVEVYQALHDLLIKEGRQ